MQLDPPGKHQVFPRRIPRETPGTSQEKSGTCRKPPGFLPGETPPQQVASYDWTSPGETLGSSLSPGAPFGPACISLRDSPGIRQEDWSSPGETQESWHSPGESPVFLQGPFWGCFPNGNHWGSCKIPQMPDVYGIFPEMNTAGKTHSIFLPIPVNGP